MAKLNVFNSSKFSLLALRYNQTDFVAYVCVRACVCLCISVFVSVCNAYIIRNVTFTYWFPLSSCQYTLVTLKTTKTTKQIWWHTCARVWLCLSVSVSVCNAHVIRNVTWTFIYSFPHFDKWLRPLRKYKYRFIYSMCLWCWMELRSPNISRRTGDEHLTVYVTLIVEHEIFENIFKWYFLSSLKGIKTLAAKYCL